MLISLDNSSSITALYDVAQPVSFDVTFTEATGMKSHMTKQSIQRVHIGYMVSFGVPVNT
jgi:hypothetical protein